MSMKKMAAVLLAVVMMLCLLPTAAFAVDEVRVYVGGCGYLNDGTTSCGEGTVTLNRAEKTLTIENIETSMLYIYGVGDDVLGRIARHIRGAAVDLGRVLAAEGAAAVAGVAAVGIDDDLAAG